MNHKQKNFKFPFDIVDVEKDLRKHFPAEKDNFVQVEPNKYFFPQKFRKFADEMYNFEVRKSDIWTVSIPRSGCTWTQEMIWLIANNMDYKAVQSLNNHERFLFFERSMLAHDDVILELLEQNKYSPDSQQVIKNITNSPLQTLNKMEKQRFIKTHIPLSLLPPSVSNNKAKIIYIARNPRDVAISLFYLSKLYKFIEFKGDFEQFSNHFMNNEVVWCPYWAHVKEGWKHRNDSNVLFLFYEEMKKDLPKCIRRVAEFLNKPITKDEITKLTEYLQFDNLSKVPAANKNMFYESGVFLPTNEQFIRKGKSNMNNWPEEYTPEMIEKFEQWMKDNMADTDLQFLEA